MIQKYISNDVFRYKIIHYLSIKELLQCKSSSKFLKTIVDEKIKEKTEIIKRFYRYYKIPDYYGSNLPYYLGYEKYKRLLRLLNRKIMYRKLINKIGVDWKKIPEDVINFSTIYGSSRYLLLKNWLETNPVEINKRTKRYIMLFLIENRITTIEIIFGRIM